MGSFPTSAKVVIVGAGIVGNSVAYHLATAGLAGHRPDRQGTPAEPRRLHGPRQQLPVPRRPQQGDGGAHARERPPVPRVGRLHECGGLEVARSETRLNELRRQDRLRQELGHRVPPGHPGRDQGAGPVHRRVRSSSAASTRPRSASATRSASAPSPARRRRRWVPWPRSRTPRSPRWASRTAASGA